MLVLAPQICCKSCLEFGIQTSIGNAAQVLLESTGAHVHVSKGGSASDEKNCIKSNSKQKNKRIKLERHKQLTSY